MVKYLQMQNFYTFFSNKFDNLFKKFQSMYKWCEILFKNTNNNNNNIDDDDDNHQWWNENNQSIISFKNTKQNLIQGIDDDVVIVFTIFSIILLSFIYYLIKRFDHITTTIFINNFTSTSAATSSLLIDTTQQQSQSTISSNSTATTTTNNNTNNMFQRQRHFNSIDSNCPVCLNPFLLPVETNCGHLFCGQCIIVYWQQSQWRDGPIKCPVCRQQVNILLPCFQINQINSNQNVNNNNNTSMTSNNDELPNGDSSSDTVNTARQVTSQINSYNRRFSGEPRPWYDYLYDLPTMLRHLSNDFFSFSGLFYMFRLRVIFCFIAAILYLISPLDMIPEAVFGIFGLIDDIVIVILLAIYVTIIYRRFLSSRWRDD